MSDTIRNENDPIVDPREGHVAPEAVEGAHDADGTMGRVAGTGSGAISGAIVGSAAGPIGTIIGGIAGAVLGAAAGNAAHHVGDDQDDVNVETGSGGDLGKNAGAGAGSISGAIIGATAGPVGAVAGAVAGGMLGAAAGNAAKDMGGDPDDPNVVPASYAGTSYNEPVVGTTSSGTGYTSAPLGAGIAGTSVGSMGMGTTGVDSLSGMGMSPVVSGVSPSASVDATGSEFGEAHGHNIVTGEPARSEAGTSGLGTGAIVGGVIGAAVGGPVGAVIGGTVGSLAGGVAGDASEAAEGGSVSGVGLGGTGVGTGYGTGTLGTGTDLTPGNNVPGVQTGGVTTAGADTRGLTEKAADALTGDRVDDKTGGVVAGSSVGALGMGTTGAAASTRTDDDVMRVDVIEETLNVGKETRQTGEVEVSKRVVEEQVQVPVTLRHEEVIVTRHDVDRPVASGDTVIGESEVIRVPVHEEVAHVTKEARVAEEIEIEKRSVSQQQTISDTVRHEVVDINQPTTGTTGVGTLGTGADLTPGNNVPGVQTGGTNADGTPDTRGLTEKAADALTGDQTDDKTGKRI